MNLESILLSERSHIHRATYSMIPVILSRIGKSTEAERRLVIARGRRG